MSQSSPRLSPSPPFDEWTAKIHDIMDEMLKRSFVSFRDHGAWQPDANVYESSVAYHVCVDLGGVEQEQIHLQCLSPTRLVLTGVRGSPRPPDGAAPLSILALELSEGAFQRTVDLPEPTNTEEVTAAYAKGFLWVTLPKMKTRT